MNLKDEEARAKLAALQSTLRGKEYSYNHKGEVQLLAKLDPGKMPAPVAPDLRVATPPTAPLEQGQQPPALSKPSARSPKGGKAHAQHASGGPKAYAASEYKELPSRSQPSAMDTMKLMGGVMLRQGDKLRRGPSRAAPQSSEPQMSRQEFQQYARATERRDTIAADRAFPAGAAATAQQQPAKGTPAAAAAGGMVASGQLPALKVSLGVDPNSLAASLLAGAGATSARQQTPSKPNPLDVNLALTSSLDWGSSGGAGASKGFSPPQGALPKGRLGVKERSMEGEMRTITGVAECCSGPG